MIKGIHVASAAKSPGLFLTGFLQGVLFTMQCRLFQEENTALEQKDTQLFRAKWSSV